MTYRDGTAHYEYKEPVSKTVDVEMNPNYFQFSSLTQNMMKRVKFLEMRLPLQFRQRKRMR